MAPDTPGVWLSRMLRSEMDQRRWTQTDAARAIDVSQQSVSNWLKGKLPEPPQAMRLAKVLGQEPIDFLGHLWPEIAESDPVPSELRVLIDRATDAQVVEIVSKARSIVESGRRTRRAQPRPTITDTDHLAHAADRDDTKIGRSGKPHRPRPERSDDYDDFNQGEEDP